MKPWLRGILTGFTVSIAGALLALTPMGLEFEQGVGLSWLFKWRGPIAAPTEVVVIAIDDQTGGQLGLSRLPREWPRSIHARLVENLTKLGASAIAFDFDFQQPKRPEDDTAFGAVIAASGRVVLAEKLTGKRQPLLDKTGKLKGSVWVEQLITPIAPLASSAKGLGPFPLPKVEVAVHEFWAFKPSVGGAATMPAVAMQIHAMPAYAKLQELVRTQNLPGANALPAPLPVSARAAELRRFMNDARKVFLQHPELEAQLGELSRGTAELEVDEAQRIEALTALYGGEDHRFLNFYGPPGSITTIPYHVIAGGDTSSAAQPDLKGKVAFVGFSDLYDPGQPDRFYTVFTNEDGVDLSGVEIAATSFANLLTHRDVQALNLAEELAVVGGFGALAGITAGALPAILGVPLLLASAAGYAAYAVHAFGEHDLWLPMATPFLVQLPLALFIGLFTHYFLERKKKTRAAKAISLYLPEQLARDFTEKNLDSSALNRVTYSVCFASDMAGFTSIAEKLPPSELASFLNDYFESLSKPLKSQGVDVIEFRADGVMCAWTAERPNPDTRRKALTAGLEAIASIAAFKQRHELLAQSLRIGLEEGTVYVGHAGGGGHFVYSIVGDSANTAARIEGLNKYLGTQLLASRVVTEGVDGLLTRYLGDFIFVGKSEPLAIVEIMASEPSASPETRRLASDFDQAMADLGRSAWNEAAARFEAILADHPDDGPARFHLERCRRFAEAPPELSPWVVAMDSK